MSITRSLVAFNKKQELLMINKYHIYSSNIFSFITQQKKIMYSAIKKEI